MRDVVVIGGGLSGLAACLELEKSGVAYTIIEVRPRFGGAIRSRPRNGFTLDAGAFVFQPLRDSDWLRDLGLADQQIDIGGGRRVFPNGTESLIAAMSEKLTGGRLMRMAVSSIGVWRRGFSLCLENGLVYDAGALIIAAPARFASRMLRNLAPDAALRLSHYRYDSLLRLSLGYPKRDLPAQIRGAYDMVFPFVHFTDAAGRAPDEDHLLIQIGARARSDAPAETILREAARHFRLPMAPIAAAIDHFPEADPLSCYEDEHAENIRAIREALPPGIQLIGSDYCLEPPQDRGVARLDERIDMGRRAAKKALEHLGTKRRS